MPHSGLSSILLTAAWLFAALTQPLSASECDTPVAQSVSVQGQVEVSSEGNSSWSSLKQQQWLCPGDRIRVGANSRAGLLLNDDTLLRLAENSSVRISAPSKEGNAWLDLLDGVAHFLSRVRHSFQVNTPYVNASIEGTEFTVHTSADGTNVTVLEGQVLAANAHGEVHIKSGEQAQTLPGKPPQSATVVDPLDAVQWAFYYPPVTLPAIDKPTVDLQQSYEANRQGDIERAFVSLNRVANVDQEPALLVYRASLHLQVGGLAAARRDLAAALKLEPEQADALALMSIISTALNEPQHALELAQRAEQSGSAASLLALSYARQALFQLPEALEAAEQATQAAPDDPLTWSRVAQIQLMFRRLNKALQAANRAVELAPDQAQPLITQGFAQLIMQNTESAKQSFEQAAAIDQAAPLPRLGLGLVEIRRGNLETGRRQLETAANLDPGNALIRSYLGKAYYAERSGSRAATQFALAKEFDDLDPTAWFYDAILKQSENRPVEAMRELQTSVELNDNRAVYRSRLLLDQDAAARNASQARIYQDLGFEQLARREAYQSLQTNPQTHSAHRLLSDSYASRASYEKARMSELLQSQLLQPLNRDPIQPQLAVSRLGILNGAGPTASGFSEYTPLFVSNGFDLQFNAIKGNNNTFGNDLILSGLHDRVSFSLGQFHYETDGWRANNDLKQDTYDAFVQASLSPSTSIQLEYRHQDAESGDLAFAFDPEIFNHVVRKDLKRKVSRVGLHHQFTPESQFIVSAVHQDLQESSTEITSEDIPFVATIEDSSLRTIDSIARTFELQFMQRFKEHSFTFGVGNYSEEYTDDFYKQIVVIPPPPSTPMVFPDDPPADVIDPKFKNAYLYSQLVLPARVSMTLGMAYEDFENTLIETQLWIPKFGLIWEATDILSFRAAYLESLARPLHLEQTVEQTQVAGFNQRFDDVGGTEIKQFGIGLDARLGNNLSIGGEFNRRDLQVPVSAIGSSTAIYRGSDDKHSLAYLYWTATDSLGLSISYERQDFASQGTPLEALTTERTPLGISYHWPWGLFLRSEATYIDQKITRSGISEQDSFWNLDAVFGYRFPKRYGKAEIVVKNLLDKEFSYYDLSFHTSEQLMPQFQPERQVFVRFSLDF